MSIRIITGFLLNTLVLVCEEVPRNREARRAAKNGKLPVITIEGGYCYPQARTKNRPY